LKNYFEKDVVEGHHREISKECGKANQGREEPYNC